MPDWRELVRRRLGGIRLSEPDAMEVVEELADHLEEAYQAFLDQGLTVQAASRRALQEVADWRELRGKIESSRERELQMTNRVRQFWFPAFLTILLAMVFLMVIETLGPKPWVSPARPVRMTPVAVVHFAWIVTLPFIGALGAWLSARAGARPRAVFGSIIFPVLPYLAFFVIGLPVAVIMDDHVAHNIMLPAFFVGFSAWVMLPAVALLAGGLPVHRFFNRSRS